MNIMPFSKQPICVGIYGTELPGDATAMRVDAEGRPVLRLDATQTVAADSFDIRDLLATDFAAITATGFDIRALSGNRDSLTANDNAFFVTSGTATILAGGTTVLQVDTSPYASSAFLVRVEALAILPAISLQLSPVDAPASYFTTVASEGTLVLGGLYLFVPPIPLRYARIFGTGLNARFTAYYVGQV